MNAIKQLKQDAADKRDAAIRAAKLEYNETVQKIAELDARLKGQARPRPTQKTKIADIIWSVLPGDRTFTLTDVMGALEAAEPERRWVKQSVYVNLNRFLKAGAIKRVKRSGHKQPAVFAMPEVDVECDKTMLDWAKQIDGWESTPAVELMVKMTEAGYQMESEPTRAVRSLERELKKIIETH